MPDTTPIPGYTPLPTRIVQTNILQARNLVWNDVLLLLKTGYNIRCSGTLNDGLSNITNKFSGDSWAVIAGFPKVITALETAAGGIAVNNAFPVPYRTTEDGNTTMVGLMRNIQEAVGEPAPSMEKRDLARAAIDTRLNMYTPQDRVRIIAAFDTLLTSVVGVIAARPNSSFIFARWNYSSTEHAQYAGFGKGGKRNVEPSEVWPSVIFAGEDSSREKVIAGLLVAAAEIVNHRCGKSGGCFCCEKKQK